MYKPKIVARGVYYLPWYTPGGGIQLGAVDRNGNCIEERVVPPGVDPVPVEKELWRLLREVDPDPGTTPKKEDPATPAVDDGQIVEAFLGDPNSGESPSEPSAWSITFLPHNAPPSAGAIRAYLNLRKWNDSKPRACAKCGERYKPERRSNGKRNTRVCGSCIEKSKSRKSGDA